MVILAIYYLIQISIIIHPSLFGLYMESTINKLVESNTSLSTSTYQLILLFHKKNPEVIFTLTKTNHGITDEEKRGLFRTLISLDRTQLTYWNNYFSFIKHNDEEITHLLKSFLDAYFLSEKIYLSKNEAVFFAKQIEDSNFLSDTNDMRNNFVRLFYFLGMYSIDENPSKTEKLWKMARDSNPGWSYTHVELAALSLQRGLETQAKDYLQYCLKFPSAKAHCEYIIQSSIPPLGFFSKNIMAIPEILKNQ